MRPVAKRLLAADLAHTPGHSFFFGNFHKHREHSRRAVRSIAKGLFLGFAARAPGITAGFHCQDNGLVGGH